MSEMTVRKLVKDGLWRSGADGLVHQETECGCGVESLFLGDECPHEDCVAAIKKSCPQCGNHTFFPKIHEQDTEFPCCWCGELI